METTGVVRKKPGRPPKIAKPAVSYDICEGRIELGTTEIGTIGSAGALVAISPSTVFDEQAGAPAPVGIMDTSGECRRSSRKKIIKFDVRDLLNKHRKPHKIQIEARIDSNAPTISSKPTSSVDTDSGFIEKTSIIQRSISFDHTQNSPTQVPIPLKTQIFKPNQSSSMIVAMESINTGSTRKIPKSIIETPSKLHFPTRTDVVVPKRRGRPPKNRNLIEKPVEVTEYVSAKESPVISDLKEQPKDQINVPKKPTITEMKVTMESSLGMPPKCSNLVEIQTDEEKIIECIKEVEVDDQHEETRQDADVSEPIISDDSFQIQFEKSILQNTAVEIEVTTSEVQEECVEIVELEVQRESSSFNFDKEYEEEQSSEIIQTFEVIPVISEEKQCSNIEIQQQENLDRKHEGSLETKTASMSHITLPLKKQLSKLQEIQNEINACESSNDSMVVIIPERLEICSLKDATAERKTSTPTGQRSERRSGRRLGDGSNKTLEETFAEIAANSSKEILNMASPGNIENLPTNMEEISLESIQVEGTSIESVISVSEQSSSRSMSPKNQTSEQEAVPVKRRGRKPKPKLIIGESDSNSKDVSLVEHNNTVKTDDIIATGIAGLSNLDLQKEPIKVDAEIKEKASNECIDKQQDNSLFKAFKEEKPKVEIISKPQKEIDSLDPSPEDKSNDDIVIKLPQNSSTLENSFPNKSDPEDILDKHKPTPTEKSADLEKKSTEILTVKPIPSFEPASKVFEGERKNKEHKIRRKDRYDDVSPSSKSSSHHKRSSSSHKNDSNSSKIKSHNIEYLKKRKISDTEDAYRNEAKYTDNNQKSKISSSKERLVEELRSKSTSTSESSKKSSYEDTKQKSDASTAIVLPSPKKSSSQGSHKISSSKKIGDVKSQSFPTKEKSEDDKILKSPSSISKEKDQGSTSAVKEKLKSEEVKKLSNEALKTTASDLKDKFVPDDSKKPPSISSEKPSDVNLQKTNKVCKDEYLIKEKVGVDVTKKSSSTSQMKKSSSFKEKLGAENTKRQYSTPDDKMKKSSISTKEKTSEDNVKKISSFSKETVEKSDNSFTEAKSFDPKNDKRQHDNKKHKIKLKSSSSSSKSKTPSATSKEHSIIKATSSNKDSDKKIHKRKRKHKESPDVSSSKEKPKSQEFSDEITQKAVESTDEKKSLKKEIKDPRIQARKERQKKLKEAFEAAIQDESKSKILVQVETRREENQEPSTSEKSSEIKEIAKPPTPGEPDSITDQKEQLIKLSSSTNDLSGEPAVAESDLLHDIEKFIVAGEILLKRDYKISEDEDEVKIKPIEDVQNVKTENDETIEHQTDVQSVEKGAETTVENLIDNLDTKIDVRSALDFYETPADTPVSTPASVTPSSSPTHTDNSVDTYYYSDGVRRSHRLKKITDAPKALVGRGLVRDRDRERLAMRDDVETKSYYSMEDHLMDLAEVEAKNAKFLKEMEERLSNFEVIKENEYHCERIVSREARRMICDCFLTPEEAERGELGCGEDCLNRLLMIECSVNCKVGERCTNRRFQKYLCAPCRVFRTEKKGFGIMADVEIHPGEFIMEYVGEVLDSDEFEDRRVAYSKDKNRHYYFMALRSDAIIDATIKGNVSRFINHSCDPNAETQKWTVNGELRIGFFSRKNIMPGEEITFDYQYQRYGREAQRCYCESANCRGWIGEEPASDEGEQIDDEDDDDDDEDDEYEEDESDVVSMVKGLMSVEDGEDEDGKDDLMSEETRRTIEDAAVKAQLRRNQTSENAETSAMKDPSLDGESDESKLKFMAYLSKISAKIELHKKNAREEKKRKRRQRKQAKNERRSATTATGRFLEDPDLEDEIDFLSRCGLKNQSDTLRLSRLMVRAKLVQTRLNLLAILRAGELPCRRLFLDYHGLHLLHGWINEDGRTDMTIRMAILETLESLPIPNKTILTESKVYQAIRGWCNNEKLPAKAEGSSSSPSDDSSKESATGITAEKQTSNVNADSTANDNESPKSDLEKLALKLLTSWDSLPEIFRIPKRERIEQMKEHEREADRQYAATVEANTEDEKKELSTDRYQRDRFERRFGRPQGSRTITVLGTGVVSSVPNKRLNTSDVLSPDDTKHLSKEQRRKLFAAKVARDEAEKRQAEQRREFETKCTFFGLDPLVARTDDIPFCVSDNGKWYNERRQIINTPPAFAHVPTPKKAMSTNPADYFLPPTVKNLPPEWAYAITEQGKIYYYHLKHRVPQWEPPTVEQINKTKWSDGESESEEDEKEDAKELSEERIKEIEAIETQEDLTTFLKKIVQEQRQARYKRLVDERPISPRREEDRIYNQIEMRKYKENKEKIKKRKEEIRRRRSEAIKNSMLNMCTLGSLDDKPSSSSAVANFSLDNIKTEPDSSDLPEDALPIQDYLLSSDEDNEDIDEMKAECNNSPLLEKIVQGDKIVDELDALTTKRQLKRPLPPHREFNFDINSSGAINNDSLYANMEKFEHKKRKQDKKEKSKRSKESSDAKYRKLKEKFRCEIAGIIVQHLKPYRKDSCVYGRIKSNEDFNHLAKKLTHFVMIKELKYCESVGQTLVVTESVKNKSREFIRKYMAKYQAGYVKPDNDPEFKDIPYTL